jgi:hypothetical protein
MSYNRGHQVHYIQARVKRDEQRFDTLVNVIDAQTLELSFHGKTETFHHHDTGLIAKALGVMIPGQLKSALSALLLEMQTGHSAVLHSGAFAMFHLARGKLSECFFVEGSISI